MRQRGSSRNHETLSAAVLGIGSFDCGVDLAAAVRGVLSTVGNQTVRKRGHGWRDQNDALT
jgi:hypothetical protein